MGDAERLAELAASTDEPPDLLTEMIGLRKTLSDQRTRDRLWRLAFIVGILAALLLWNGQRNATDRIEATRSQSRVGLCHAIDDMRAKHNHFVTTAIDERQAVIDATNANAASTDAQKASTTEFFNNQIANYRQDLLTIIDCADPAAVATLFTTPGG